MVVVENKTVMVTLKVNFEIGSLKGVSIFQTFLHRNNKEEKISWDIEYIDDVDLIYMGMEVTDRKKLWNFHSEMGIELNNEIIKMCLPQVETYLKKYSSDLYPF